MRIDRYLIENQRNLQNYNFKFIMSCPSGTTLTALLWDTDGYGNYMIPMEAGKTSTYSHTDFFSNSDPSCPVTNCSIARGPSCTTSVPSNKAQINPSFPFELTIYHDVGFQYETFCYICETSCCNTPVTSRMTSLRVFDFMNPASSQPQNNYFPWTGLSPLSIESSFKNFFDINSATPPCVDDLTYQDLYNKDCSDPDYQAATTSFDINNVCTTTNYVHNNFDPRIQCCMCSAQPQSYESSSDLQCGIFEAGCTVPHTQDVFVASSSPFAVTANQNVVNGYLHNLCYKCSYNSRNKAGQIKTTFELSYDNWIVSQDDPFCVLGVSPETGWSGLCLDQTGTDALINPNGISDLFTNSNGCSPHFRDCALHDEDGSGCQSTLGDSSIATMGSGPNFEIKFSRTSTSSNRWCVKCYEGSRQMEASIGKVVVDDITQQGSSPHVQSNPYSSSTSPVAVNYNQYFSPKLTSQSQCQPTVCTLQDFTTCSSPFTGSPSHLFIDSTPPFAVKQYKNIQAGYQEQACVKCTIDNQTPSSTVIESYQVQQKLDVTVQQDPATLCNTALVKSLWSGRSMTFCSNEYQNCNCPIGQEIAFGAVNSNGMLDTSRGHLYHTVQASSTSCTISALGDPLNGVTKKCWCIVSDQQELPSLSGACACLGIVPSFNDGPASAIGSMKGQYCSDTWNTNVAAWCYVSPGCSGSTPTGQPGWQTSISWKYCDYKNIFLNQEATQTDTIINPDGLTNFFVNSNPTYCAVQSCALKQGFTCSTPLSTTYAEISSSTPFHITVHQNQQTDLTSTAPWCIDCTVNSLINSNTHNFQHYFGIPKVSPILTQKITPFANTVLHLNTSETSTTLISSSYLDFFDNEQPTNCPTTTCSLLQSDCTTPFSDPSVAMDAASPWGITASQNKTDLYKFDLCVQCQYATSIPVVPSTPSDQVIQTQVISVPWAIALVNCNQQQIVQNMTCQTCPEYQKAFKSNNTCASETCDQSSQILLVNGMCQNCSSGQLPDDTGRNCVDVEQVEINMAPILAEEQSFQEPFQIDGGIIRIQLGEIQDVNQNFKSIYFKSEKLGSLVQANNTGSVVEERSYDCLFEFDLSSSQIVIDFKGEQLSKFVGSHEITVVLTDTEGAERSYNFTVEFVLNQKEEPKVFEAPVQVQVTYPKLNVSKLENEIEEAKLPFTARITKTTFTGLIIIKFNSDLKPLPIEEITESDISMKLLIEDERDILEPPQSFNYTQLSFTWTPVYLQGRFLMLQVDFENPFAISPTLNKEDILHIHFNHTKPSIFEPSSPQYTPLLSHTLSVKLKQQTSNTEAVQTFQTGTDYAGDGVYYLLIVSLVFNYALVGAADYITMLLRYLQMVVHLQLIGVPVPGIVMMSNSAWVQVSQFDIFSGDGFCEKCELPQYFESEEERDEEIDQKIISRFQTLWYKSYNCIDNIGSLGIVFALYFVKVSAILTIKVLFYFQHMKNSVKAKKLFEWLVKGTFFNQIFAICIESYFAFPISAYLHLTYSPEFTEAQSTFFPRSLKESITNQFSQYNEDLQSKFEFTNKLSHMYLIGIVFSILIILILILTIPAILTWIIFQDQHTLHVSLKDKCDVLYYGVKTSTKSQKSYYLVFVLRRLSFLAMVLFQETLQIPILLGINLVVSMYVCSEQRLVNRYLHTMEVINEVFFGMTYICMILFSEWTPHEVKNTFGWVYIAVNSLMVLSNLIIVIHFGLKSIFLVPKKIINLIKFYFLKFSKMVSKKKKQKKREKKKKRVNKVQIQEINPAEPKVAQQDQLTIISNQSQELTIRKQHPKNAKPLRVTQHLGQNDMLIKDHEQDFEMSVIDEASKESDDLPFATRKSMVDRSQTNFKSNAIELDKVIQENKRRKREKNQKVRNQAGALFMMKQQTKLESVVGKKK